MSKDLEADRTTQQQIAPFGLRMPPALKDALEKAASARGRSLTAEITERLQSSLESPIASIDTGVVIEELLRRFPNMIRISIGQQDRNRVDE